MSRSVFAVDRGVFDHPVFADEPYTEREAWLWLVAEAAWKPRRVRVRNGQIDLARGQLAHATRFMASKWQWTEARVRRFLGRLKNDAMIDAHGDAHATLITICNYAEYQRVSLPSDAHGDAGSDAQSTRTRRKEEDRETKEDTSSLRSDVARKVKPTPTSALAEVLDAEHAAAVVEHRQRIRKPLTAYAAKILAGKLARAQDPNAAADAMIANGWQGFDSAWLDNRERRQTGPPRSQNGFASIALELHGLVDEQRNRPNDIATPGLVIEAGESRPGPDAADRYRDQRGGGTRLAPGAGAGQGTTPGRTPAA